jgi:hypothetical protein
MIMIQAMQVGICDDPECKGVHIGMMDEDGDLCAMATIPLELLPDFIENLRGAAYHLAVEKCDDP